MRKSPIVNLKIQANLPEPQKLFIESALQNLNVEFNLYLKNTLDTDVLEYHERAMVGFFNNGIIRSSSTRFISLMEYIVRNNIGRADLLINDTETKDYYLFEAKHKHTSNANELIPWMNDVSIRSLNYNIDHQLIQYYLAEESFYKDKSTFLCAIVFEIIDNISEDFNNIQGHLLSPELENVFYTVYHFEDHKEKGLAVYGLIRKQ